MAQSLELLARLLGGPVVSQGKLQLKLRMGSPKILWHRGLHQLDHNGVRPFRPRAHIFHRRWVWQQASLGGEQPRRAASASGCSPSLGKLGLGRESHQCQGASKANL